VRIVDNLILEALEATGVPIHDGFVKVDNKTNAVLYPTPYAVFYSSVGDDDAEDNPRLVDVHTRRSVFFSIVYVGKDRNQTKWAGEKIREAINGRRFVVPGHKAWKCKVEESQRVRRDDDAVRPDGSPLFYGVDNYAISITLTPQGDPA
jgi:hypothetical protein